VTTSFVPVGELVAPVPKNLALPLKKVRNTSAVPAGVEGAMDAVVEMELDVLILGVKLLLVDGDTLIVTEGVIEMVVVALIEILGLSEVLGLIEILGLIEVLGVVEVLGLSEVLGLIEIDGEGVVEGQLNVVIIEAWLLLGLGSACCAEIRTVLLVGGVGQLPMLALTAKLTCP